MSHTDISDLCVRSGYYMEPRANIVGAVNGTLYKKVLNQFGNPVWSILLNKYSVLGWYHVDSPFVHTASATGGGKQVEIDGMRFPMYPPTYAHYFSDNNITYFTWLEGNRENTRLFLHNNGTLIATLYPNFQSLDPPLMYDTLEGWMLYCEDTDDSYFIKDQFIKSKAIRQLPILNPTSDREYILADSPWENPSEMYFEDEGDTYEPELRPDPWDNILYSQQEFNDYYGRDLEWQLQEPTLILKRKNIDDMIFKYNGTLSENNINHLLDKMVETFL